MQLAFVNRFSGVLLGASIIAITGCGGYSNIGEVSGTVTLDGAPLANARVVFTPVAGGSPSYGTTDSSGNYVLYYAREVQGAEIGEHVVTVRTETSGNPDSDPPVPASPEKVPMKYNANSELKKSVDKGSQTIDLQLDSEGEIAKPGMEGPHGSQRFSC